MTASTPSAPPGNGPTADAAEAQRIRALANDYDGKPVRAPRVWPSALFLGGLVLLAIGAQAYGLKSIAAYATMRAQMDGLRQDQERMTGEVAHLRTERGRVAGEVDARSTELARVQEQLVKVAKERDLAGVALTEAQQGMSQAREARMAEEAKTGAAKGKLDELTTASNDKAAEVSGLKEQEKSLRASIAALEPVRSALDATLKSLGEQSRTLNETAQQLTQRRTEVDQAQQQLAEANAKLTTARTRQTQATATEQDTAKLLASQAEAQRDLDKTREALAIKSQALGDIEKDLEVKRRALAEQEGRQTALRGQLDQLEPRVRDATARETALKTSITAAEEKEAQLRGRLQSLDARATAATAAAADLAASQKELTRLRDQKANLDAEIVGLSTQREGLATAVEKSSAEQIQFRERMAELLKREGELLDALLPALRKVAETAAEAKKQIDPKVATEPATEVKK